MPPQNTAKKKTQEQLAQEVKKIRRDPHNLVCADCPVRSTPYICVNYSSFICTECSGIHRKLNHRVKSIAVCTFTEKEVENIRNGGNAILNRKYLARYKTNRDPFTLPREGERDKKEKFIQLKYVDKKWYKENPKPVKEKKKKKKKKKRKKSISISEEDEDDWGFGNKNVNNATQNNGNNNDNWDPFADQPQNNANSMGWDNSLWDDAPQQKTAPQQQPQQAHNPLTDASDLWGAINDINQVYAQKAAEEAKKKAEAEAAANKAFSDPFAFSGGGATELKQQHLNMRSNPYGGGHVANPYMNPQYNNFGAFQGSNPFRYGNNNNSMNRGYNAPQQAATFYGGYNEDVVKHLVQLRLGTKEECISASIAVTNPNDINMVADKVKSNQEKNIKYSQIDAQNKQNIDANDEKNIALNEEQQVVRMWFTNSVKLPQYTDVFINEGYEDMTTIVETVTEEDLVEFGINKKGHRKRIMLLINKYKNDNKKNNHNGNNVDYSYDDEGVQMQIVGANVQDTAR